VRCALKKNLCTQSHSSMSINGRVDEMKFSMYIYIYIYIYIKQDLEPRQALYHLSHAPSPFCFSYIFLNRVWRLSAGQHRLCSSYLCFLHKQLEHTIMPTFFAGWDGVSQTFCIGWPPTMILLISSSWKARNTAVGHCTWHNRTLFSNKKGMEYMLQLVS
jgi:hypothetical protein